METEGNVDPVPEIQSLGYSLYNHTEIPRAAIINFQLRKDCVETKSLKQSLTLPDISWASEKWEENISNDEFECEEGNKHCNNVLVGKKRVKRLEEIKIQPQTETLCSLKGYTWETISAWKAQ